MLDNTLKANDVRNLAYLRELVNKLHLDEEFEGHNYELLDDIEYIIACQIKIIKENIFNCFLDKFYVLNIIWIEYTKYDILKEKLLWQQQTSMQRQH